jgi:hypothetical protein
MNSGRYVLSQVLEHIHWQTLKRLCVCYGTETRARHFGCRQQLICMVFAQLTWREGLRDLGRSQRTARPATLGGFGQGTDQPSTNSLCRGRLGARFGEQEFI